MKLMVASTNIHKLQEFKTIFSDYQIFSPFDFGINFDHPETATSFYANALEKALALYALLPHELPQTWQDFMVIADDSGICIDALDGAPGIFSARYGSKDGVALDAASKNQLVIAQMQGQKNRNAHFTCAMAAVFALNDFAVVQATWPGLIVDGPGNGSGGFGYDPILYLPEFKCTVAELGDQKKALYSHRAQASAMLREQLKFQTLIRRR